MTSEELRKILREFMELEHRITRIETILELQGILPLIRPAQENGDF